MGELSYVLSNHAEQRIRQRGIKVEWIEQVLKKPYRCEVDELKPSISHSLGFVQERGNRVLRVVYNGKSEPWVVITAYFD